MRNGMIWYTALAMSLVVLGGCQSQDENTNWDPDTNFPDWTYDKPVYTEPAVEPKPYETVANNIDVYYSRSDAFFIRHPNGKQGDTRPRTAVWYSLDGGNTWLKNGFYGLYQSFYTLFAEQDGQYWIRFVGPNMGVAEVPPGQPHEIHVVDTLTPMITLEVDPPPFEEVCVDGEGNEVPAKPDGSCCCCHTKERRKHIYRVGEKVNVYWTVSDANLEPQTIELSTCFARFPHNLVWSRFKGELTPSGSLEVVIPPEAANQAGMRFRMIAHDKAGNIGLGLSEIMDVETTSVITEETPESAETNETIEPMETVEPIKTIEPEETTPAVSPAREDLPEPAAIEKPRPKPAPLGLPEPPSDLTEPVNIETPASKPARKTLQADPTDQSAITKPTPILSLSDTLPAAKKAPPTTVAKTEAPEEPEPVAALPAPVKKAPPAPVAKIETPEEPEPIAALPTPVKKTQPTTVEKAAPAPKEAKKPTHSETSIAAMEREMEKARKTSQASKPAPEKDEESVTTTAESSRPVPVKVLAKVPAESKPAPAWKPLPPSQTSSAKPTTMKLGDIPEKVQQGWPADGMTMHGGVSRLLNWLPDSAENYKTVNLQFSSNNGKRWITVAKDLKPRRVATWTVPMVTSKTCLLRVVGSDANGVQKTLETSESFRVDAGKWETIDMSGFKMQVPSSK
jgi:hypothetical protein